MPTLFTYTDKKFWFFQPNLTRWRHAFRSPRNSLRINQEIGQTHYDLARVNVRAKEVQDDIQNTTSKIFDGWDFTGELEYFDYETSATETLMMGLHDMVSRIENLRNRIRNLEG